ncbi:hypothetical protein NDU88_005232 [Pleurodeles waltl]|uniref:Uncharacterized protein n=1 Tax=Pleurodeles waltl TaxID=8319 RepID=A0AAV7NM45_PLEWA|nr:hypothetical protein NDU88_005232 [Pleurodeles waltl]
MSDLVGPLDRGLPSGTVVSPRDPGGLTAPEGQSPALPGISVSPVGPCSFQPGRWLLSLGPVSARCLYCSLTHSHGSGKSPLPPFGLRPAPHPVVIDEVSHRFGAPGGQPEPCGSSHFSLFFPPKRECLSPARGPGVCFQMRWPSSGPTA